MAPMGSGSRAGGGERIGDDVVGVKKREQEKG
jgi:hypothetical protein